MLTNLVSMITKSFSPVNNISSYNTNSTTSKNKDNLNPFLGSTFGSSSVYGKNQPVTGGYFAGYYNGKPNIVGRRLFIEV